MVRCQPDKKGEERSLKTEIVHEIWEKNRNEFEVSFMESLVYIGVVPMRDQRQRSL